MSLRAFHLLFIGLSIVLVAFFGAWAIGQYRVEHDVQYIVIGVAAILAGAVLAVYGATFQRKTRNL